MKSTNNIIRGFTLIELLAVIVVLAIISLIATPIIMGIIEESQKGTIERSYDNIEHTAEIYFYGVLNGTMTENPMVVPMTDLKDMLNNYTSDMEGESVVVSKKGKYYIFLLHRKR